MTPAQGVARADEGADEEPRARTPRRLLVALLLASISLVAAAIAVLGPADRVRTTYSWPPEALPAETPTRRWQAPLLLLAQKPEAIAASLPCGGLVPLPDAGTPVTVLATARGPEAFGGLAVTAAGTRLAIRVRDTTLARVPLSEASAGDGCAYDLRLKEDGWSLAGGPDQVALGGALAEMPIVTGLFSELDLARGASPSVDVTTQVHATKATTRQEVAWIVAALAAIGALALVTFARVPTGLWSGARGSVRRARAAVGLVDGVVGAALAAWWVLSPAFLDDGWVITRQRAFTSHHGFSNYFDTFGVNIPNGYWLEWLQQWTTNGFDALVALRVPALACLTVVWIMSRWCLAKIAPTTSGALPVWALAAAFLGGALAWGMTLRPEPVMALLATTALVCAIRFRANPSAGPLAVLAVIAPLAPLGHHSGIVVLAPALVLAPTIVRWARSALPAALALVIVGIAVFVGAAFVGSDVSQRAADAASVRANLGVPQTWKDEAARYAGLGEAPPLRRASVALLLLAVMAFVLRRRRAPSALDLPAASLGVALLLFIVTPTKWMWHFGALIGIAAVAVAAETVRVRRDADRARGWQARPFLVLGSALLALVWAFSARGNWGLFDLRTLDWARSSATPLSLPAVAVAFGSLLLAGAALVTRRRGRRLTHTPWEIAAWSALVVALPAIAFTIGLLAADAVKTDAWTLTRQNLRTMTGDADCGLAEELVVPLQSSIRPLRAVGPAPGPQPRWLPPPHVSGVPGYVLGPVPEGRAESPWFRLTGSGDLGVMVHGSLDAPGALSFEWGRARGDNVDVVQRDRIESEVAAHVSGFDPWRLVPREELPDAPRGADAVRIRLETEGPSRAQVGVSSPFTYDTRTFAAWMRTSSTTLVHPFVRTFFPCTDQPAMRNGIVEAPDLIVADSDHPDGLIFGPSGPFYGLRDLYGVHGLPTVPHIGYYLFEVDKRAQGAAVAPATPTTTVSRR